jgi:SAM-dependent methyltransferase
VVEVGAGTGKATVAFAVRGVPVCCVEPDARMAAVLRARVADHRQVEVRVGRFEDWEPPAGGVDLVLCAQAWLWVERGRVGAGSSVLAPPGTIVPERMWFSVELADCGLFTEVRAEVFGRVVSYSTARYLALVRTFSAYRALPPAQRRRMHDAIATIVDDHGGVIDVDLATVLALGRRPHT